MKEKRKVVIVDCENINAEALSCIESFDDTEVVLFLSQNVGKNSIYEMTKVLANTGATITIKRNDSTGKNSLDFKIVAYLALRITENINFFILSNDKGYLAATDFLKDMGFENASLLRPNSLFDKNSIERTVINFSGACKALSYA